MRPRQIARRFPMVAAILMGAGLAEAAAPAPRTGLPDKASATTKIGNVTFEMVRIPAGSFRMGSPMGDRDSMPVHEVHIDHDFYMGRTEVTVRQFRAFVAATGYQTDAEQVGWATSCPVPGAHPHQRGLTWRQPGFESGDDFPAVVISHHDALAFCRWLSAQTGRSFRLPTEAEWEYAARAGRQDDATDHLAAVAWYEENSSDCAHPVGTKAANAWGLYDVQGNAWEWCLDVWRPDYRAAVPDGRPAAYDPAIPEIVWRYVLRGGSWIAPTQRLSLAYRTRYQGSFSRPDTGFRIVLAPVVREDKGGAPAQPTVDTQPPATDPTTGHTLVTAHGTRFEFARVPAGEFLMGGTDGIEKPVHHVRIGYDFEMGTTEVTVGQFRAFLDASGYVTDGEKEGISWTPGSDLDWQTGEAADWRRAARDQSDHHPAIFISWYDAMVFCDWLSHQTGQKIRLPSEAEWEYACRAGTTGPYAGELNAMGWYRYNSCSRTHPVAQKQPNAWGLYDMHGNVWEWCLDFFLTTYAGAPTDGRPRQQVAHPTDVVSRGGSFRNPPGWLASGCRMGSALHCSNGNNGFRLVRVLKDGADKKPAGPTVILPPGNPHQRVAVGLQSE